MLFIKKLTCVIISIVIIALFYVVYTRPFLFEYTDKITIYTKNGSFTDGISSVIKNEYFSTDKIYGESAVIDGYSTDQLFNLFDAQIINVEVVDGVVCYYGYSTRLPYNVKLFDTKVNLHVAVDGDKIILGTPLIFGSY